MKVWKKMIGFALSGVLAITAVSTGDITAKGAAAMSNVDETVRILPGDASVFHDINGDGFGEFEGWGTSLCWWANRLGYSQKMTKQAGSLFFGDDGLDLNIGRYNAGGGDCVGEVLPNNAAEIYDIADASKAPEYHGANMSITTRSDYENSLYLASDADFGITRGTKVGSHSEIGWINALGAAAGNGGNLIYKVNAKDAGSYTVKILLTHDGNDERDVMIRINGDENSDQIVTSGMLQSDKIAEQGNYKLCRAVFSNVSLRQGENQIAIGGNKTANTFTLNFIKMAVIPSGQEGILKDALVHTPHITRSDSKVPGYCTNVTKLTEDMAEADYAKFDRVDTECGYAWDYDWSADARQMNILKEAKAASGAEFIGEIFSNSPPYFMTNSGCTSGALSADSDNLRGDSYHAFAVYMADIIVHWAKEGVIDFQSASPMNEPDTTYWGAYSNKQEGCHFDSGASQSKILEELAAELAKQKEETENAHVREVLGKLILSASDETDIDKAVTNYGKLSDSAKAVVTRIDTHTYSGSKRQELRKLAEDAGQNLWMSEVDGSSTAGTNAGEMSAALGLAKSIITDLNGLRSSAWILWNAVDTNADSTSEMRTASDYADMDALYRKVDLNGGYWGIAFGDHNREEIVLTKKYYGYGQFTRYIRPGACIIGNSDSGNTLTAYDPGKQQVVIVAINTSGDDKVVKYNFSNFSGMGTSIQAIRSSGSVNSGENWADVSDKIYLKADAANKNFEAALKKNSITTFLIDGVTYDRSADEDANNAEIPLSADMVSGSNPWNNNSANGSQKTVDNNLNTFFDGVADGYVQIDLGKIYRISGVGYAPRNDNNGEYHKRCNGAMFYGSNNGTDWTKLYTIPEIPQGNIITKREMDVWETDSNYYRYIKYTTEGTSNSDKNCNVAELKLYGAETDLEYLTAAYEKKAAAKTIAENQQKTAFERALAAAKAIGTGTPDTQKQAAMEAVVAAYDALEFAETPWDYTYSYITGVKGDPLYDTKGNPVQAHGGQVQKIVYDYDYDGNGTVTEDEKEYWCWIGEDKTYGYRPCPGIRVYISRDLYNWKDMGDVLRTVPNWETFTTDNYFTDLYGSLSEKEKKTIYNDLWTDNDSGGGCVIERPKMLYNKKNDNYVIWFHADGQIPGEEISGSNYSKSKAGVAVSGSPFGPFRLLGSYLLNYNPDASHGFDGETGGHVRDMNLFKDEDETAYVLYSSDGNETMHIAKLNEDYTNVVQPDNEKAKEGEDFARTFIGESREAPAMFRYHGKYYLITSGCTGWDPNQASYAVAEHPFGPWKTMGDPCTDSESNTTYRTQSTCVFPVDAEKGKFIYMGDRWTRSALHDSRYIWIPVEFLPEDQIALRRHSNWTLDELEGKGTYQIETEFPKAAYSVSDLKTRLPEEIAIRYDNGEKKTLRAAWSGFPTNDRAQGTVMLTAKLSDGTFLSHTVFLIDEKMIYFFDCASDKSEYVKTAATFLSGQLRNTLADQPYEGNQAGYVSALDEELGTKNAGSDVWAHGYYAKTNKNIKYGFDLEAGKYTVSTGYQEWWNTARPTKITVSAGGKELVSGTFTLAQTDKSRQENLSFELTEPLSVNVTISKTGSADPVLSWIAVMKDEESSDYKEARQRVNAAKDSLLVPEIGETDTIALVTSHENGSRIVWSAPNGSAVKISEDGSMASVVRGTEAQTVTLTAVITDGEILEVSERKTFELIIPAKSGGGGSETDPEIEFAKNALNQMIGQAAQKIEGKTEEDYTPESWSKLQEALYEAQNLSSNADKDEINAVKDRLEAAILGLTEKTEETEEQKEARRKVTAVKESLQIPEVWENDTVALPAVHENGSLITWKVPENSAIVISEDGKTAVMLRGTKAVTVTITAVISDPIFTNIKETKTFDITVPAKDSGKISDPVKAASMKFASGTYKIAAGKKLDLNKELIILPKDAKDQSVTWSIETTGSKYASLKNGVVTMKKSGAGKGITVTAKANDGSGKSASVKIKIMKNAVTKVSVKSKKLTVKAGKKIKINPTVKTNGKKANKKLSWTSSNAEYATVNAKGIVSTKKAGAGKKVTITAKSTDGTNKRIKINITLKK